MISGRKTNMNLCKFDIKDRWQGFTVNWGKRNWVTDIFLYGIQIATVLYSLVMIAEIIDMIYDFRDPYPLRHDNRWIVIQDAQQRLAGWSWSMYSRLFLQSESH